MQHGPAASSGSNPKAPGSAGGYLLTVRARTFATDRSQARRPRAAGPRVALSMTALICAASSLRQMSNSPASASILAHPSVTTAIAPTSASRNSSLSIH